MYVVYLIARSRADLIARFLTIDEARAFAKWVEESDDGFDPIPNVQYIVMRE